MNTEYDDIASLYQQVYNVPFSRYVDSYSYFEKLGDLTNKSILDLGCGGGFYTRELKRRGASKVVGVDQSSMMLKVAQQEETENPQNIEYILLDAGAVGKIGNFDLVVSSYLLNHASNREQLFFMCQAIASNLKPDGRFVGLINNIYQPPSTYINCLKYGFTKSIPKDLTEGTPITVSFTFLGEEKQFSVVDYYLSRDTYEWAFRQAGLTNPYFSKPIISEQGIEEFGQEFWQDLQNNPHILLLESSKANCQ